MAYLEVWKSGTLITRRRVDDQMARKGCRIRIGSAGEVRLAIGQSQKLGKYEVRMFEGDPPTAHPGFAETASSPPDDGHDDQSLPSFSKASSESAEVQRHGRPDIEGYKIIKPLGEGGMGMVWCAEQLSTRRQVALKLLVSHRVESPKAQARFQREVELTARLDHPNIACIYDSGLHQGMYYYAMELIEGIPLDQYVKSQSLSRTEILGLMQKVCQAVLYAHLRAVIHRDLKPSNILVSPDGEPHILDFGLAKALLDEDEALTISIEGQVAGTPAYMSPEQAAGHHSQLDTRTDVYSLGVILYELLIGQSPHDLSGSMFDVLHRIADGTIRRPCKVDKSIDSELEALLLKALAQDPEDRYASAGALAKDISNYLSGEPLDAQAPTILYFLRKKALKYRVQIAAGLAISLVLLGTALVVYTKIVARQAIIESQDWELKLKSSQLSWQELALKVLSENEQEALAALRIIRDEYISAQDEISQLNHKLGDRKPPIAVRRIDLSPGPPMASTALVRKPSLPGAVTSWTLDTSGHRGRITRLVYSPDGSRLASASRDGTIRIWGSESGQLAHVLVDPNTHVSDLAWSADGKSLRGTAAADPARRSVWDVEPGRIRAVSGVPAAVNWQDTSGVCWSAGSPAQARMLDEVAGSLGIQLPPTWSARRRLITALAFSSERQQLACGDEDGTIWILDAASGQVFHIQQGAWCGPMKSVSFSPDGKTLATYSGAGTLCLWQADRWGPVRKYESDSISHRTASTSGAIAWAPDNLHIAKADNSRMTVEILDLDSGDVVRALSGNDGEVTSISWSPNGGFIATGTLDGKIHLWELESDSEGPSVTLGAHSGAVGLIDWIPESQSLVTTGLDGMIKIWERSGGSLTNRLERQTDSITCAALSRDGSVLATGSPDGIIRFWNTRSGWSSNFFRTDPSDIEARQSTFTAVAWSPDGRLSAWGDSAGKIRIWSLGSRRWQRSFPANCGSISSLAWSVDGRGLLCGGSDGKVRIWDAKDDFQEHVVLLPLWGPVGPGIAVNAAGDYRGPPGLADNVVYAVQSAEAQVTLSRADFKSQYGWVNEPWQVGLYRPGDEPVERIYVDSKSAEPQDGKAWASAFSDLQDALSIAQPNTEIWVASGVYRPDRGTGARTASFHLKNGVRLLGGFAGTETSSHQRDPNSNETILSGDLKGDDGPDFTNNDENCHHVVVARNTDPNTLLDGFTIMCGNASGPKQDRNGGGIYMLEGSPTLTDCVLKHNSALHYGGGMRIRGNSHPRLISCTAMENLAGAGGGVAMDSSAAFVGCRFIGNKTVGRVVAGERVVEANGGGVWNDLSSSTLVNCTFANNVAGRNSVGGGGMYNSRNARPALANCRFIENSANDGGGIANDQSSEPTLINCTFIGNTAHNSGGGMYDHRCARAKLTNCRFIGNMAGHGGGVANDHQSMVTLYNCTFSGNQARNGGGVYIEDRWEDPDPKISSYVDSKLANCTFSMNRADGDGGGIWNSEKSTPSLANCIFWGNSDSGGTDESAQFFGMEGGHISTIDYCCVQGWTGALRGTSNFGLDPLFVDFAGPDNEVGTEDDNLCLRSTSPCINAGDNNAVGADTSDLDADGDANEPMPFDIEGRPRILNGRVDIGAYENG